jgi:predicted anti-sigma-YlaC factor YlaD
MNPDELSCKELVELVTEYLEGTLPVVERARFEDHLLVCSGCRNHLDQMRRTVALLGRLTEDSFTPEARRELLGIFRNWKQRVE